MPENRHLRFLLRLLYAALALAGLWLALRFLLPWLLPFLLAFGLAALLEPAVRLLMERLHLPRAGRRRTVYRGSHRRCSGRAGAGGMAGRLRTLPAVGPPAHPAGRAAHAGRRLERWAYRFLIALPVQFQTLGP